MGEGDPSLGPFPSPPQGEKENKTRGEVRSWEGYPPGAGGHIVLYRG